MPLQSHLQNLRNTIMHGLRVTRNQRNETDELVDTLYQQVFHLTDRIISQQEQLNQQTQVTNTTAQPVILQTLNDEQAQSSTTVPRLAVAALPNVPLTGTQQNTVEMASAPVTIVQRGEATAVVTNDTAITLPPSTSGPPQEYDTITSNEESIMMSPSDGDVVVADSETVASCPVNPVAAICDQVETTVQSAAASNQAETLIDITIATEQVETSSQGISFNHTLGLTTEPFVAEPQVGNPVQTSTEGHLLDTYNGGNIGLDTVHPMINALSSAPPVGLDELVSRIDHIAASLSADDNSDTAVVANQMATSDSVGLVESVATLEAGHLASVITGSTYELVDTADAVGIDESTASEATVSKEEPVHTDEAVVAVDELVAVDEPVIAGNDLVIADNDAIVDIENVAGATDENNTTVENLIVVTEIPNNTAELVHVESTTPSSSVEINECNQAVAGAYISADSASDADEIEMNQQTYLELCELERRGEMARARRGRSHANGLSFNDPDVIPELGFTSPPATYTQLNPTPPAFFQHGIQYSPSDIDDSPYRTVLIYDIPDNITAFEVTEGIYAGPILSCQLLDANRLFGSRIARLVFISGTDATNFFQQATNPNTGLIFNGQTPHMVILETPTYPTGERLSFHLRSGAAKNVTLIGVSPSVPADLVKHYLLRDRNCIHVDGIERCTRLPNGKIKVYCNSVDLAVWIKRKVEVETYGHVRGEYSIF